MKQNLAVVALTAGLYVYACELLKMWTKQMRELGVAALRLCMNYTLAIFTNIAMEGLCAKWETNKPF